MTNDYVLDLSELTEVSITKTLVKGVKLMTDRYKKKVKVSAKINKCSKKSYIFLHSNDCKTPYIDIYIDLLSINFNLLSVFSIMLTFRSVILKSTLH